MQSEQAADALFSALRARVIAVSVRKIVNRSKTRIYSRSVFHSVRDEIGVSSAERPSLIADSQFDVSINHDTPLVTMRMLRNGYLDV